MAVPHGLLDGTRILSTIQAMRSVGMAQMVRGDVEPERAGRVANCALNVRLVTPPANRETLPRMLAGGSHHTVLTNAVSLEAIEDFARIAKIEHVIIDEDTKIREFRRELQWTAAYHRFAERI